MYFLNPSRNFYAPIIKGFYMIEIRELLRELLREYRKLQKNLRVSENAKAYQPPKQTVICRGDHGPQNRAKLLEFARKLGRGYPSRTASPSHLAGILCERQTAMDASSVNAFPIQLSLL